MHHTDTLPWYKQPLVWLVISFPLTAVIAGTITVVIAFRSDDGLVVDDYYQQGKTINLVLERDQTAQRLGYVGSANYQAETKHLWLTLASTTGQSVPNDIDVSLLHATRGGFDQKYSLSATANGEFNIVLDRGLVQGPWIIQLSTTEWRVSGRMHLPGTPNTSLEPLHD